MLTIWTVFFSSLINGTRWNEMKDPKIEAMKVKAMVQYLGTRGSVKAEYWKGYMDAVKEFEGEDKKDICPCGCGVG